MKKLIALALAAVMTFSMVACGGNEDTPDVNSGADVQVEQTQEENSDGVREVAETKETETIGGGKDVVDYDANGVKIHTVRTNADGVKTQEYDYDVDGHITKMQVYNVEGVLSEIIVYEYVDGKNVKSVATDPEGNVLTITEFEYYESGNPSKKTTKDGQDRLIIVDEYYDAPTLVKSTKIYNPETGEMTIHDEYDENRNKIN